MTPADIRAVTAELRRDPSCDVVRTTTRLTVAEMSPQRAVALAGRPGVLVEPDQPLTRGVTGAVAWGEGPIGELRPVNLEVADDGGRPIEGAAVSLTGGAFPVTAFTNAEGRAELRVPADMVAETLLVRPPRGCWPYQVSRPDLGGPNKITCARITTTYPEFPDRPLEGWGARAMGFDRLPPTLRGHSVRLAVIDSGVALSHPDLIDRVAGGRDLVRQDDKSWQEDQVGTGTHHAVLVAGRDDGTGVVGLAPECEMHACRVSPAGSLADLMEALDYCVEQRIDVALLGYGVAEPSALLAAKIEEARRTGVACVAAAGQYPAGLPGVLCVGAIGQLGTFPPDSPDAFQLAGPPTPDGLFLPRFAPIGADCVAPGVAIVSGLPPSSYGPLSGPSSAAAHVTALAALVLAHHTSFRPEPDRPRITRDSMRVDRLFQVIRASCRPLPGLDPARTGAGIPDTAVAVGVAPLGAFASTHATPYGPASGEDPLAPLDAAMRAVGLTEE
jgi:subtilisin family serine protease